MPNWCENLLEVGGVDADLFVDTVTNKLDFSKIIEPKNNETATEVWGTKWLPDPEGVFFDKTLYGYTYSFDTAWTPPLKFLEQASKKFEGIQFKLYYFEPGVDFTDKRIVIENVGYTFAPKKSQQFFFIFNPHDSFALRPAGREIRPFQPEE